MIGAKMYLYGEEVISGVEIKLPEPCPICKRMIINSGIDEIISGDGEGFYVSTIL